MITPVLQKLMTVEELARLADDGYHYELVRGELRQMSPPGGEHGVVALNISLFLGNFVRTQRLGQVFVETGFYLQRDPDTVRAPDISFLKRARMASGGPPKGFISGPPDLAVEIVSPGDTAEDIDDKVQDYLAYGTPLVWVIQPKTQSVTVYRSDGTAHVLRVNDTLTGEDVVPGFILRVSDLFSWGAE